MKIKNDLLGSRIKYYESLADIRLMSGLPLIVRLDAKNFSKWTKNLVKPYDERLWTIFDETCKYLMQETRALISYTQSDEITLVLFSDSFDKGVFFGERLNKLNSVIASFTTAKFNDLVKTHLPEKSDRYAIFDCRAFNVPTKEEAVNALIWRELDCTKNAVSSAAQFHFSHKSLQGLHSGEMQEKLFQEKGINFNDYPVRFKRGGYLQKIKKSTPFSTEELEKLPPQHAARKNPNLLVERSVIQSVDFGAPLHKIENRVELIFG